MRQQRKFKETEIGVIPEDWQVTTIEGIKADKKHALTMGPFGSNITKDNFVESGVPVIRGNNLTEYRFSDKDFVFVTESKADELGASVALPEDIVITHRGSLGQVGIIPKKSKYPKYIVSQSGMKVSCDISIANPQFVFYFLKSPRGQYLLLRNTSQTGVPAIAQPLASLRSVPIPLPEIDEQNLIVRVLSTLDDLIELNHNMNATLQKIGQALFKHWFIDFEFPNEKGKPYKSTGGEMVYIEDTGQELPKGWEAGMVSDLVNHSKDTISPYDFPKRIFFHYSIPSYDEVKWPSIEKGNTIKSNKFLVRSNSILVSKLNPRMPRIWALGEVDESCSVCSTEFQVLVPKKKWNYNYVYFSFNSGEITDEMKSLVTGTSSSHQRVRPEDMLNLKIVIPDEGVLQKFEDISFCLRQKMWQIDTENKHLCSIRDVLLPKLVSGQIRVPAG